MAEHLPLILPMDGSQLLEASAGTGKTYTITNLCLRLLLGRNVPWQRPLAISEILILTFTIAATDELKDRVFRRINDARQAFRSGSDDPFLQQLVNESADPTRDLKLLTAASQLMDDASIFTIHGFAARVLGEQAFESGTLFDQDLNAERSDLLRTASQDCFRECILTLPGVSRQLALELWPTPESLARKLAPILFRGDLRLHPERNESLREEDITTAYQQLQQIWLNEDMPAVFQDAGINRQRKQFKHLARMQTMLESGVLDPASELWQTYNASEMEGAFKKGFNFDGHPAIDLVTRIAFDLDQTRVNLWYQSIDYIHHRMASQKTLRAQMTLDDLLVSLDQALSRPGDTLGTTLARRWPVALIDEFQDTDSVQSRIFNAIYPGQESRAPQADQKSNLVMIGDPKQAIYNFRGADIYTYINARRTSSGQHSLGTNWRSSHALIDATNTLFNKPGLFGSSGDIQFEPVIGAPQNGKMQLNIAGTSSTPYAIAVAESPASGGGASATRKLLMDWTAANIVSLMDDASDAAINNAPIHGGQIAILVRRRADAVAAQASLAERGIQSVYLTHDSVFLQDTAFDLKTILQAILEPGNDRAVRAALAAGLLQATAEDIDQLSHDIAFQQQVYLEFQHYHELWREQNVAAMINALILHRGLADKWLNTPGGERQLTNLRHLTEILQQRATVAPGMYQLIKWFSQEQREAETNSDEQRQLRLESDQNLVKIVTMHASKGLEYDVVFIPMPLFTERSSKTEPALFHLERDQKFFPAAELGNDQTHRELSKLEAREEDMRLLYVALTRARYRCYLGLPVAKNLPQSGIGRLLGLKDAPSDSNALLNTLADILDPDLFQLQNADQANNAVLTQHIDSERLTAPPPAPKPIDTWRVHSYTGMTARLNARRQADAMTQARSSDTLSTATSHSDSVRGFNDDDSREIDSVERESGPTALNRHQFPRGARIGVALHSLMEHIDFTDPTEHPLRIEKLLRRLGLSDAWRPEMQAWLSDIVNAKLGNTRLADITAQNRMDEMEFHFPVSTQAQLIQTLETLNLIAPGAPRHLPLDGMMTGMIDLLYRHEDQYFILDYKSNHLGSGPDAYNPDALDQTMTEHQYRLQYLIYSVALHRLLRQRMPDYDYNKHFGGVHYLFLRGAKTDSANGVYSAKPEFEQIASLDIAMGANT